MKSIGGTLPDFKPDGELAISILCKEQKKLIITDSEEGNC